MGRLSPPLLPLLLLAAPLCSAASELYCGAESCYAVLGIEPSADSAAIKKAYRRLSLRWHPDKNPGEVEEATRKFRRVATAYEVLSDESLRAAHDYAWEHPDEHLYNTMRYYRARCTPQTPLWAVILGLLALISGLQYMNWHEKAKAFERSPAFLKLLEEECVRSCTRGRHGYQSGELTAEKRAAVQAQLLDTLCADPACPCSPPRWSETLIPSLIYHLPLAAIRWVAWRIAHNKEISEEKSRAAEEQRAAEEEELAEEEAVRERAANKQERREANARHLAERQRLEEEKRRRWAEEASRELDAQAAQQEGALLTVTGKVRSAEELRKQGHFLVEVAHGEGGVVQLVVDRPVRAGQEATVALEGAVLDGGKVVRRSKIAGEWSEGVLVSLGDAPAEEGAMDGDGGTMASDIAADVAGPPPGPAAGESSGAPQDGGREQNSTGARPRKRK